MKYNENYIKNGQSINGCGMAFCSIPGQIIWKLGLIFVFDSNHSQIQYSIVGNNDD
jgi:hypothetical protein